MERPFVYVNMAMTVDGKITSAAREYPRFTSRHDRDNMDRLRAEADAILVGAGTMRADNPALHVRSAAMREYRRSLGKIDGLHKVIVSARLDLPADCSFFDERFGGDRIVATVDHAPADRVAELGGSCKVWRLGRDRVDIRRLLRRLRERGIERLLVEGGGELNWHFVRHGLVDELFVTLAPTLLGGRDAPTLLEGEGLRMARQQRLALVGLRREGDELYLHYAVER